MSDRLSVNPGWPASSPRRFPFSRIVPWLMLASSLRFVAYGMASAGSLVLMVLSDAAVFIAFLLAARTMIEWTGGSALMGRHDIRAELRLAHAILWRVLALVVAMTVVAQVAGYPSAMHLMLGFDGIAFDQYTYIGMAWSALLAAIILIMLVNAEKSGEPQIVSALIDLARRWRDMLPAIIAVTIVHALLHAVQGGARSILYGLWQEPALPLLLKKFLYFAFVFGFAAVRLWATVAILTFALRASYRPTGAVKALPPQA